MAQHLFRRFGKGPWEDLGSEQGEFVGQLTGLLTLDEVVSIAKLFRLPGADDPKVSLELREVPEDTNEASN